METAGRNVDERMSSNDLPRLRISVNRIQSRDRYENVYGGCYNRISKSHDFYRNARNMAKADIRDARVSHYGHRIPNNPGNIETTKNYKCQTKIRIPGITHMFHISTFSIF